MTMTFKQEIAALQERIAKAESDRDTWRSSGMQQNYLEAYSRVEALELQLERLRQQGLRAFEKDQPDERERLMAGSSITYNGSQDADPMPPAQEVQAPDPSQREVMAELAITFQDGVYRLVGDYRYERLADAVNCARLQRLQVRRA